MSSWCSSAFHSSHHMSYKWMLLWSLSYSAILCSQADSLCERAAFHSVFLNIHRSGVWRQTSKINTHTHILWPPKNPTQISKYFRSTCVFASASLQCKYCYCPWTDEVPTSFQLTSSAHLLCSSSWHPVGSSFPALSSPSAAGLASFAPACAEKRPQTAAYRWTLKQS